MRVAMVQMTAMRNDKETNLQKMETFIIKAAEENASIVCFPELSLTGYANKDPEKLAEAVTGPSVERLKQLAEEHNLTILAGMVELYSNDIYISHISVQPSGCTEVYRKTHLGAREKGYFAQGDQFPVFQMSPSDKNSKFGIGLCYDLHYPQLVSSFAVQGARIVFAPHAVPIGGRRRLSIWEKYMPARAYDNGVYVLACNLVGNDGKKDFGGGIGVWNPKGEKIMTCHDDKELMMMLDLDMDVFNKKGTLNETSSAVEERGVKLYLNSAGFSIDTEQTC